MSFQVPQFLMDQYRYDDDGGDGGGDGGASKPYNIVCTQPRRISAIGKEGANQCCRCSESMLEHVVGGFRGLGGIHAFRMLVCGVMWTFLRGGILTSANRRGNKPCVFRIIIDRAC